MRGDISFRFAFQAAPRIDLIAAFNDWASKNPDKNGEPEWFALYNALHFAYPCEGGPLVGVQK